MHISISIFFFLLLFAPITATAQDILEQFVNDQNQGDIQPMYTLDKADIYRSLGRPVGRILMEYQNPMRGREPLQGTCTASIIDKNLILTNHHCLTFGTKNLKLLKMTLRMGFLRHNILQGRKHYDVDITKVEGLKNKDFDYAILKVKPEKNNSTLDLVSEWGKIRLNPVVPKLNISLFVIHHPNGSAQKLTTGHCQTTAGIVQNGNLLYSCDTAHGSSGSPVFDNNTRQVIALHFGAEQGKPFNKGNLIHKLVKISPVLTRLIGEQKKVTQAFSTRPASCQKKTGGLLLELSTKRGQTPVYYHGDTIRMTSHVNQDSWLYCFYTDAKEQTIQVLPNKMLGAKNGYFVKKGQRLEWPYETTHGFTFHVNNKTVGKEMVQCFATNRNVYYALPASLQGQSYQPLKPAMVKALSRTFLCLPNVEVSGASVSILIKKNF